MRCFNINHLDFLPPFLLVGSYAFQNIPLALAPHTSSYVSTPFPLFVIRSQNSSFAPLHLQLPLRFKTIHLHMLDSTFQFPTLVLGALRAHVFFRICALGVALQHLAPPLSIVNRAVQFRPFALDAVLSLLTKGSVSYLSSPCFSASIGGIGGPAQVKRGILAVMYWISIISPPPLKWSWVQFPRVTRSRAPTLEAHPP